MQFSLAIVATLIAAVSAVPAPAVTPIAKLPESGVDDQIVGPENCPASKTITNRARMCPMFICAEPQDGPCTGTTTSTYWMDYRCTAMPPTTTTVLAPCPDNHCHCPRAVVTALAF